MEHTGFGVFSPIARLGLRILAAPLRRLDYKAAQRVDLFIGNSTHIAEDIKRYYDREASVLFPPVNTERFTRIKFHKQRYGFVTFGRLVPMKRTDILVEACNDLKMPLTVIGGGPELERLKQIAGSTVRVLGKVPDDVIDNELANAEAFLFASYEDFGIAPVEAMAAGLPVIAYKVGGALDYVKPGITGEFFIEQTAESLKTVLRSFDSSKYDSHTIKTHAARFSNERFNKEISEFIKENCTR